jgi:exosortase
MIFFAALWLILWRQLSGEWSVNDQYSYGWFVPFFAALLFWLRWEDRPKAVQLGARSLELGDQRSEISGHRLVVGGRWSVVGIAILALLLLFPVRLFEIANPDWRPLSWLHAICVVTITLIFLWSVGGVPWLRHFAFPVLFTLVAVPWISLIEMPIIEGLMRIIAAVATETANLLGIPAQVQGNLIQVRTGLIGVNEACSGVGSLQTSLMIGLLFGELKRLSIFRRVALVAGAIAIALIANFSRAVFLVWLGAGEGISAINRWHDVAGYAIVAAVFLGTMLLATLLGRNSSRLSVNGYQTTKNKEQITDNATATRGLWPALLFSAVVWLVAVEFAAAGWYRAHEKNLIGAQRWNLQLPQSAAAFREIAIDPEIKGALRFDYGREATWREPGGPDGGDLTCLLFFFRWQPGTSTILRARAHRPDICLPSAGWRQVADNGIQNYRVTPGFSLPFRHFSFVRDAVVTQHSFFADAFFCLGEDSIRSGESQPLAAARPGQWSAPDRWRVVQQGLRNPGQQVMQFIQVSPHQIPPTQVEEQFSRLVPTLVQVESGKQSY